jgi:hypothetical protein
LNFPFVVLAFFGFLSLEALSGLSLMYCVKFLDRLREKFGTSEETADYTDGTDREGTEQKAAKILADCLEFFTEGNEGKEEGGHSNRTDFASSK